MYKYTVSYTCNEKDFDFIYQHESAAFPDPENMLHLAAANLLEYHPEEIPVTKLRLTAIVLIR